MASAVASAIFQSAVSILSAPADRRALISSCSGFRLAVKLDCRWSPCASMKRNQRSKFQHGDGKDCLVNFAVGSRRRRRASEGRRYVKVFALGDGQNYEFREDGAELEVRVQLPSLEEAGRKLTARFVAVDTQATSLAVGVETVKGVRILLDASPLYGRILPSETVWFVDDKEVVLSLKKSDIDISWPDLVEGWVSLAIGVSELLKGTSVYIVGESTEVNWAVAQEVAAGLQYVPLQTKQLIEQTARVSVDESKDGKDAATEVESAILSSLSKHVRCVVATLGGDEGVAARYSGWKALHGGFSVWLSHSQAQDEESAQAEALKAKETGSHAYSKSDVIVALASWDSSAARPTAQGVLQALKYLLMSSKNLPGKKSLYVRLGCRGDWPEIMPPGWNPNSQDKEIKAQSLAL